MGSIVFAGARLIGYILKNIQLKILFNNHRVSGRSDMAFQIIKKIHLFKYFNLRLLGLVLAPEYQLS